MKQISLSNLDLGAISIALSIVVVPLVFVIGFANLIYLFPLPVVGLGFAVASIRKTRGVVGTFMNAFAFIFLVILVMTVLNGGLR